MSECRRKMLATRQVESRTHTSPDRYPQGEEAAPVCSPEKVEPFADVEPFGTADAEIVQASSDYFDFPEEQWHDAFCSWLDDFSGVGELVQIQLPALHTGEQHPTASDFSTLNEILPAQVSSQNTENSQTVPAHLSLMPESIPLLEPNILASRTLPAHSVPPEETSHAPKHPPAITLTCSDCGANFDRRYRAKYDIAVLASHQLLTNGSSRHVLNDTRLHKCVLPNCTEAFACGKDLRRHQASRDELRKRTFYCPINDCEKSKSGFNRRDNLKRHVRKAHPS